MPGLKKIILTYFLSFCFLSNENNLLIRLDSFGHSDILLYKINTYRQSKFKIGSINFNLIRNTPIKSYFLDFDFIGPLDSTKLTSQFIYNKGDYSFRETKIAVRNVIDVDKELYIKVNGRKYPGIYNNLGDGYILQNYLVNYLNSSNSIDLKITKYYRKEDALLPLSSLGSNNYIRYSELHGTGINICNFDDFKGIEFNYSNVMSNLTRSVELADNLISYNLLDHFFEIDYYQYLNKDIKILSNLSYHEYVLENNISYSKNSLFNVVSGLNHSGFLKSFDNVDLETFLSVQVIGNSNRQKTTAPYRISLNYSNSNAIWTFTSSSDFKIINTISEYWKYEEQLHMNQLRRKTDLLDLKVSLYNVGIISDEEKEEKGQMHEFEISIGSSNELSEYNFLDRTNIGIIYNEYNYGPIDNRLSINMSYIYDNLKIFKKCKPYIEVAVNNVELSENFGIYLGGNDIIRDLGSLSNSALKTSSVDFLVGLLFEQFEISYKFLNANYQYDHFNTPYTDIRLPIYQMNYVNIKWQFKDK